MGNLLEREIIKNDFEPKYSEIVSLIEKQMDDTKTLFDSQNIRRETHGVIFVQRNMPDVSGGLKWCNELRERIKRPIDVFNKLIDHPIAKSDQMQRIKKKYNELLELINTFSTEIYKEWCIHVGTLSNNNLEKKLIVRNPKKKSIQTNFDRQVKNQHVKVVYINLKYNQLFIINWMAQTIFNSFFVPFLFPLYFYLFFLIVK